jgi:hypothetical protein
VASRREFARDQRRQLRELTRLFAARFWDNDLVSVNGDVRGLLIGIFAVLAVPGWIFPVLENIVFSESTFADLPLYQRDWIALPHKAIYLALSMTILGIVTVLEWDTLLLDQRDYTVLGPLPIRLGTILAAKIATLALFWAVVTLVINAVSAVMFPVAVIQKGSLVSLLWTIRAHMVAVVAGNAFIFLAMVAVQGILMNLMGWRRFRRVSPYVQLLLVALLLLMFFSSIETAPQVDPARPLEGVMRLLPPMWFLGLYQYQLGWHQPVFSQLAGLGEHALGVAALVAVMSYALSYRRSISRSLDDLEGERAAPQGWVGRALTLLLDRVLLRAPSERAAFHFVRQTILRSRSHRVLVAAYAGAGLGLVFQSLTGATAAGDRSWWQHPRGVLLPVPLVLSLFLLLGLRHAFSVPAELRANWIFQLSATSDPREYREGIRKAVLITGILPLFGLLLPLHVILWGWYWSAVHLAFGFAVACLVMDVLLAGFDALPFTCSYVAGKANVKTYWVLYVLGFMAYVSAFSGIELLILDRPARLLWFLGLVVLAQVGLDHYRRRVLPGTFSLDFNGEAEPAVRTLGLLQ